MQSLASEESAIISGKQSMFSPMPDSFVLSDRKTTGETFSEWAEERSLDDILKGDDMIVNSALLEKYAKEMPLEDFPQLLELLTTNLEKKMKDAMGQELLLVGPISAVMSVWLERDFDAAKNFTMNYLSDKGTSANRVLLMSMGTKLIFHWTEWDKDGCVNFIKEESKKGKDEMWEALFVITNNKQHPEDTFRLLQDIEMQAEKANKNRQSYKFMYSSIFSSWYEKNAQEALEQLRQVKNNDIRDAALTGILEKMASKSPNDALTLIEAEWKPEDQVQAVRVLLQSYALESPLDALEFIRQGEFSGNNRAAAMHGLLSITNAQKLQEILNNEQLMLSDDERKELIIGKLTGSANYDSASMAIYASMVNNNSPEEKEATFSLFLQLPETDRAQALKEAIGKGKIYPYGDMMFEVLASLQPEQRRSLQSESIQLMNAMSHDPKSALEYFSSVFYEENGNSSKSMDVFNNMMRSYLEKDTAEAVAWVNDLPEGNLKNQAALLNTVHNIKENPAEAIQALERYGDKEAAKNIFFNVIDSVAGKDPQFLAEVLLKVNDTDLTKEGINASFWRIQRISEGEMLSFIDDLAPKPDVQDEFRSRYIDSVKGGNPELAIELALEMQPNDKNKERIRELITQFKKKDAVRAKVWCEENGVPYEE